LFPFVFFSLAAQAFIQGDKSDLWRDWLRRDHALAEYGSTQRSEELSCLASKIIRALTFNYDEFILFGCGTVPGELKLIWLRRFSSPLAVFELPRICRMTHEAGLVIVLQDYGG
jgi:hypothetical protein